MPPTSKANMANAPIRRATAADGPACAAILNAWIDATPWMPRTIDAADLAPLLSRGLPLREAYVIGAPVAGYLSLDPDKAHIWGFYVGPRGQGFGRALLMQAKQGRRFLTLNTHAANADAQRFYRREGFVQIGTPWQGEDGIDEIKMTWHRPTEA